MAQFLVEIGKSRILNKEEEILLATHVQEHSRIARACQYFKQEEGRDPSDLELCNLFNMVSGVERHAHKNKQIKLAPPTFFFHVYVY